MFCYKYIGLFSLSPEQVRVYRKYLGAMSPQTEASSLERRRPENRGAKGAEWGGMWGRMFPPLPTWRFGECHELPSGVRGPGRKRTLEYLKATESPFLHLYTDALNSSNSVSCHFGGGGQLLKCIFMFITVQKQEG